MSFTINTNLLVAQMKLWCIVEGEKTIFGVWIDDKRDVDDLKTAIKPKLPSKFRDVNSPSLQIWRISKSQPEAQQLTVANMEGGQISPKVIVGEYWADLTADVHVFIANPLGESTVLWLRRQLASIKLTFLDSYSRCRTSWLNRPRYK